MAYSDYSIFVEKYKIQTDNFNIQKHLASLQFRYEWHPEICKVYLLSE